MKRLWMGMLCALAIAAGPAAAQGAAADANMQILRDKIKADKKALVAVNMELTDAEAKAFWPVYERYQKGLQAINERIARLVSDYAAEYRKGAIPDTAASRLIRESIAIDEAEVKLKRSTLPALEKALPAAKAARYLQIENKIRAIVRYELAAGIPLAP